MEQRSDNQIESRCAFMHTEDKGLDAGTVGGRADRGGKLSVADAIGRSRSELAQPVGEAAS
jgi:hypothetical protein